MLFALRNEKSDTIELDILGTIGGGLFSDGVTASSVRRALKENQRAKTIQVQIHSRGGDVLDGISIYNLLAQHPARVVVDIIGVAASMASVIAMAGNEIRIAPSALFMIHNPWGMAVGEADDLRALATVLDKMRTMIGSVYALRSGNKTSDTFNWMDAETYFSADEAKRHGFIDKITSDAPSARAEERKVMLPQPIVPQAVARAGMTSRFAELAAKIIEERDPDKLEALLAERDALIRNAENGEPRPPLAAAEALASGMPYHRLSNMARADLSQNDPKRFYALRTEHARAVERLTADLAKAKSHAEYRTALGQLRELQGIA